MPLILALLFSATTSAVAAETAVSQERLSNLLSGHIPANVAELQALQERIQDVATKVLPTTVAVRVGNAHGSGVIINSEGYVLTAAHVVGQPNRDAIVRLHDGTPVRGRTLGVFRTMDAGLIQITTHRDSWEHARIGDSSKLQEGQWCLATGHPGGFQPDRGPIVRVGRILSVKVSDAINTDCTLIGGDSGGPLFDMQGNVIGIHSRIGGPLTLNLHVPVNIYREQWERLAAAEVWGSQPGNRPYLGVESEATTDEAVVSRVVAGSAAAKAGLRPGDVIRQFAGRAITDFKSLQRAVGGEQPGSRVVLEIERDGRRLQLEVVLGRRQETNHRE